MEWLAPIAGRLERMAEGALRATPNLLVALLAFAAVYGAARLLNLAVQKTSQRLGRHRNLGLVLGRLTQSLLMFLGALVAAAIVFPSFKAANLVQLLGISSVAIGFAFRDILQNFLAGLLILWTQPFRIGDQIVHDGVEGTVEDIQTRATFIHTYDGRRVVVPNAKLYTGSVTVNTAHERRRVEHDLMVGMGEDLERVRDLILEQLRELPDVLAEPAPDVRVVDIGEYAMKLRVRWWIRPPRFADLVDARDQVLLALKRRLLDVGVDLPFPTTRVLLARSKPAE